MNLILTISNFIIPIIIFYIIGMGILMKSNPYDEFIKGAKEGLKTVVEILPTLIGLMIAVGILRSSNALTDFSNFLGKYSSKIGLPGITIPLLIIKMFSSSAATGLLLDIFKEQGADSLAGNIGALAMSSTETIFYTMSVYFLVAGIKKTRWTLPGALLATTAGLVASVFLGNLI